MQLKENVLFNNRYLLKILLGRGGFSEVWLVEDTKVVNKKMALKVYAPGTGLDEDGVKLFSREFEIVFDLTNSYLLRPSHYDVFERSPYLVMPFCEHGSTSKLTGNISEEQAWHFLHDVASGLAYMHGQKPPIIHQDIKPDNVLIDHDGNYLITDFGISSKARSTLRHSISHVNSGTVAYMAPERFGTNNAPIKASDIWSLGATLFELMIGDVPFGDNGGLIQKSGADIPNINGVYSQNLKAIVNKMLTKETWERPTAEQLLEWSEKHLKGERVTFPKKEEIVNPAPVQNKEPSSSNNKIVWIILGLLIFGGVVWFLIPKGGEGTNGGSKLTDTAPAVITPQPVAVPPDTTSTVAVKVDSTTVTAPNTVSQSVSWVTVYDKYINIAQSAFKRQDYEKAIQNYNTALSIAEQNNDVGRINSVRSKITEWTNKINAKQTPDASVNKQGGEERLQAYNFVGIYTLGSNYMVVQRKTDYKWGIIDRSGNVKIPFIYDQISSPLRNGYYALLYNIHGWDVFNSSLDKIASGVDLDNYYK